MTDPYLRFPDVVRCLVDDLVAVVGEGHTGGSVPADLASAMPFVRIMRVGGNSLRLQDYATVDVDVFATTYVEGEDVSERIRQRLVGPPPPIAVLDRIECQNGPRELPTGSEGVRRFNTVYQIVARRHWST